eukprot:m51a1_g1937 putative protein serine threonine kinase (378) ;mRNA; f:921331-923388
MTVPDSRASPKRLRFVSKLRGAADDERRPLSALLPFGARRTSPTPQDGADGGEAIPKRLRHYLVGGVLGEGSMCKVLAGYDTAEDRRVAIKVFSVRCLPLYYIVFDCLGGGTLKSLAESVPDRKLPLPQVRFLFAQLLDGLAWLHSCGVFHRDVKPDNLMISCEGDLLITDLGCSLVVPLPTSGDVEAEGPGAPAFRPPEVARTGRSCSAEKIDVWAAGVTLYMLTVGKYPFGGDSNVNVFQLLKDISEARFEVPRSLPAELQDLLKRMLDPVPARRATITEARAHPWLTGAENENKEQFARVAPQDTIFTPENLAKYLPESDGNGPNRRSCDDGDSSVLTPAEEEAGGKPEVFEFGCSKRGRIMPYLYSHSCCVVL